MRFVFPALVFLLLTIAPLTPAQGPDSNASEHVSERYYDAQGRLVIERGPTEHTEGLWVERHFRWADQDAKPEGAGGGKGGGGDGGGSGGSGKDKDGDGVPNKNDICPGHDDNIDTDGDGIPDGCDETPNGGGGGTDPGTDCASDSYVLSGWSWSSPWSAYSTQYAAEFDASGDTWDAATGASIFGGVQSGLAGEAGVYDGVNQIDFTQLSNPGTIAVTTTWYYTQTGEAVESDAQYNTYYNWATDGSAGAMDVQNIGTHEIGHTFGLDHGADPCLTMYAYGANGETEKRTLGDGDILGIQALYGV